MFLNLPSANVSKGNHIQERITRSMIKHGLPVVWVPKACSGTRRQPSRDTSYTWDRTPITSPQLPQMIYSREPSSQIKLPGQEMLLNLLPEFEANDDPYPDVFILPGKMMNSTRISSQAIV